MTKTTIISASNNDHDELIHTKTLFRRYSKGPIMFNGCSPSGDVIIIENISSKKQYDLAGWHIERQTDTHPMLRYIIKNQFIVPPLTTIELWSSIATPIPISPETQEQQQQSFVSVKTKILTWNNARQWSVTRLFDHTGRERAIFSHRTLPSSDKVKKQ
ncbi:unnamed protein product [Adineta steineri]|uniref:LTD domain-containing protein n=1 Tax=Adineta steineri TaxID=433720 RepID=A0A814D8S1_9BILA|nr:unnamed protein product [Adineta steineri]CAF1635287.1 unnamed protein product [Adineta steineri]